MSTWLEMYNNLPSHKKHDSANERAIVAGACPGHYFGKGPIIGAGKCKRIFFLTPGRCRKCWDKEGRQ